MTVTPGKCIVVMQCIYRVTRYVYPVYTIGVHVLYYVYYSLSFYVYLYMFVMCSTYPGVHVVIYINSYRTHLSVNIVYTYTYTHTKKRNTKMSVVHSFSRNNIYMYTSVMRGVIRTNYGYP